MYARLGCVPPETTTNEDRGAGLKEFTSDGTIWEFHTVQDVPYWAYDLHRHSVRSIVRFNRFEIEPTAIGVRIERTAFFEAYGNVIVNPGAPGPGAGCIHLTGRDERLAPGAPSRMDAHHNTCVGVQDAITFSPDLTGRIENNVGSGLVAGGESPKNLALAPGGASFSDYNAFDANADYRTQVYNGSVYATLADWQAATGYDTYSRAAAGGVCTLDPATLAATDGTCTTMSSTGGAVGAFGLTSCVGHACP